MNTCDCPMPPGGRATCDDDQLAICRVTNGVAETFCISPPSGGSALVTMGQVQAYLKGWPLEQRFEVYNSMRNYSQLDAQDQSSYRNFVLSVIKVEVREPDRPFDREDMAILAFGAHRIGDSIIRFKVPIDQEFDPRTWLSLTLGIAPGAGRAVASAPGAANVRV